MIERWSIIFGEVLLMTAGAVLFGLLQLPVWLGVVMILVGVAGIIVGFFGGELPARNYFQVIALAAAFGIVMALGAVLSGASVLFGIPLTVGSFVLLVIVVGATFFAGFEPEAIEATEVIEAPDEGDGAGNKELEGKFATQV